MILHLVRHGPTHARGMVGWTDLPADLSDRHALARLSAHLPDVPVVSSDLSRAVATADAIAGARPRLPHDPALREMHFGDWEMLHHSQIDPALSRRFWDNPGDVSPPNGESWNDLAARVNAAVDRLAVNHDQAIVVVHFGVILTLLQRALGVTARQVFAHKIDNLSVTELHLRGEPAARLINHNP